MINLAMGLGIESKRPLIWTQLQLDCCAATGVTCTSQLVTGIDWRNMGLNGSINGTALPTGLQVLYLYNSLLTGNIPTALPAGLQYLHLNNNQFTGNISMSLPAGLQFLNFGNNKLTGNIPAELPTGLFYLYLPLNRLTGNIPTSLPTGLQILYLYNNQLTGNIPAALPTGLRYLYLPGNQLTGNIPSTLPAGLQYLLLYNNQLTGMLKISYPIDLRIQDNLITDVIIAETASLVSCNVSNNPLLASPHISNLTMCVQSGLYSASLLPSVMSTSLSSVSTQLTALGTNDMSFVSSMISAEKATYHSSANGTSIIGSEYSFKIFIPTSIAILSANSISTLWENISTPPVSSLVLEILVGSTRGSASTTSYSTVYYSFKVILRTLTIVEIVTQFFKLLGSSLVLIVVIYKTPWRREFKSKMRKRNKAKDGMPH